MSIVNDAFWIMPATPNYIESGVPYITSKNIKNGVIDFDNVSYISKEDFELMTSNRKIQNGDLLITMIGTIGEAAIVKNDRDFYGQNIYLLRLNEQIVNKKYYFYYLTSEKIKTSLIYKKNASSQGYIKADSINNLIIPLPSIEKQKEIVEKLDKFDKMVNDLVDGLPAEIQARQQQYEYYRNKLLSFKEKQN